MSKADFLADIRAARAELAEILAARDERALAEAVVPGLSWTAKEVVAHLIGYDQAILQAIADVRAGRKWTWGWTYPNFDDWNERTVGPRRAPELRRGCGTSSTTAVRGCWRSWSAGPMTRGRSAWTPGTGRRARSAGSDRTSMRR